MATVLLVVHLMIAAALVGLVLLQRSEGGALGMGGGGGGAGGFLTGRGTANILTRLTAGLAAAFFATSMLLTILAQQSNAPGLTVGTTPPATKSSGDAVPAPPASTDNTPAGPRGGILDSLQKREPVVPQSK